MNGPDRFLTDHESLLIVARRLRDDRADNDSRFVESGKLTSEAAADRATCAAALVTLWQHVVDGTEFDTLDPDAALGVSWAKLRADLDAALLGAETRAKAATDDQVRRDIADCIASMRLHLTPVTAAGTPNVAFCHDFNLWSRRQRWPEQQRAA